MSANRDLVKAIISSRDFCGDEREAARQVFDDEGCEWDEKAFQEAMIEANKEWAMWRRKAKRA